MALSITPLSVSMPDSLSSTVTEDANKLLLQLLRLMLVVRLAGDGSGCLGHPVHDNRAVLMGLLDGEHAPAVKLASLSLLEQPMVILEMPEHDEGLGVLLPLYHGLSHTQKGKGRHGVLV